MITAMDGCTGIPSVIAGGSISWSEAQAATKEPPTEAGGSYLKLREQN